MMSLQGVATMHPQRPTRILSQSEYFCYCGQKFLLTVLGRSLFLLGSLGVWCAALSVTGVLLLSLWYWGIAPGESGVLLVYPVILCYVVGALFLLVALLGKKTIRAANQMKTVVLFSQHIAHQMPAEESLVRPGSEPELDQSILLLRAAGFSQETPAEELLRAWEEE
jgi:hypothetical protein